VVEVEREFF